MDSINASLHTGEMQLARWQMGMRKANCFKTVLSVCVLQGVLQSGSRCNRQRPTMYLPDKRQVSFPLSPCTDPWARSVLSSSPFLSLALDRKGTFHIFHAGLGLGPLSCCLWGM